MSVLVVLIGGLIAFAGSQLLTKHTSVLVVARDVPVGSTITAEDLAVASMTKDPNVATIPAADKPQIIGLVAQVGLRKGTTLTRSELGSGSGFTAGQQLVALPLKQGQFPARGLVPGQKVLIVSTPGANAAATSGGGRSASSPGGGSTIGGMDATVAEVGALNPATQVTVVDVQVSAADGVPVAQLASTGNLAVILLPAGR